MTIGKWLWLGVALVLAGEAVLLWSEWLRGARDFEGLLSSNGLTRFHHRPRIS